MINHLKKAYDKRSGLDLSRYLAFPGWSLKQAQFILFRYFQIAFGAHLLIIPLCVPPGLYMSHSFFEMTGTSGLKLVVHPRMTETATDNRRNRLLNEDEAGSGGCMVEKTELINIL